VEGPGGLEPAMLWLGEGRQPLSVPAWKAMFATANRRCREGECGWRHMRTCCGTPLPW
jgi:hypothetical protein